MNKARKEITDDLGDCNRLVDLSLKTDAVFATKATEGFVMAFVLYAPTQVEALETYVKKMPHGGASGYAAPRISVRTTHSSAWQVVFSSKDVWGQFDQAEKGVSHIMKQAAGFRFDHWNVHKFYTTMENVIAVKMEIFGEINKRGRNSFSMDEVRIISGKKQGAIKVPAVHVGPGKFVGCFKDYKDRDLPISMGRCNYMTPKECNSLCSGYAYYAVQFHGECRCADKNWKTRYHKVPDKQCNAPCNGDISIMCGGGWTNTVFTTDPHVGEQSYRCAAPKDKPAEGKAVDEAVSDQLHSHYETPKAVIVDGEKNGTPHTAPLKKASQIGDYVGCYKDSSKHRDFTVSKGEVSKLTPEKCNHLCSFTKEQPHSKFDYFALQNGKECRCGKADYQSMYGSDKDSKCDKACSGDKTAICGGHLHNTVFKVLQPEDDKPVPPVDGIQHPEKTKTTRPDQKKKKKKSAASPAATPPSHKKLTKAAGNSHKTVTSSMVVIILIVAIASAATGMGYVYYKRVVKVAESAGYSQVPSQDARDNDNDDEPWIEEGEKGEHGAAIVFRDDDVLAGDGTA